MSNVTENPNDKQSPGNPLGPDEVAPTDNNGVDDDGLGPVNEDEDEPGLPGEKMDSSDLASTEYDRTSSSV